MIEDHVMRLGTDTAGYVSLGDISSLNDYRVVIAKRDGGNKLRLIVWDIDDNGNLTRRGTGTAGHVSQISIVSRDRSRVVIAKRDGSGNLRLIVWQVDGAGNIVRRGTGIADSISQVAITSIGDAREVVAMRDGSGNLRLIAWGRITDNFTYNSVFSAAQVNILRERHRLAFNRIEACTTLDGREKEALIDTYKRAIEHGINTNPNANASAFINGSQILVNLTNFFSLVDDERAQTLIHEMKHCAGFSHPTRFNPPAPDADTPGDNGLYYGSPPLQAEICIAGSQSDLTCVKDSSGACVIRSL